MLLYVDMGIYACRESVLLYQKDFVLPISFPFRCSTKEVQIVIYSHYNWMCQPTKIKFRITEWQTPRLDVNSFKSCRLCPSQFFAWCNHQRDDSEGGRSLNLMQILWERRGAIEKDDGAATELHLVTDDRTGSSSLCHITIEESFHIGLCATALSCSLAMTVRERT